MSNKTWFWIFSLWSRFFVSAKDYQALAEKYESLAIQYAAISKRIETDKDVRTCRQCERETELWVSREGQAGTLCHECAGLES